MYSQSNEEKNYKNSCYLELFGIGGYASINYERLFWVENKLKSGLRSGFSIHNLKDFRGKLNPDLTFPFSFLVFYGSKHNIEAGIGATITSTTSANLPKNEPERFTGLHPNLTIGYRYQKTDGRFIFRANYSPVLQYLKKYTHWGGVSAGYAF